MIRTIFLQFNDLYVLMILFHWPILNLAQLFGDNEKKNYEKPVHNLYDF